MGRLVFERLGDARVGAFEVGIRERERVPELEDGLAGGLGLLEIALPAAEQVEVELAFLDEVFDFGVAHFGGVADGEQIVGDLSLEESRHFGVALDAVFGVDGADAIEAGLPDVIERSLAGGGGEQRKLPGFADVREDRVERVVILGGDGIVLVIVAAGAGDGEAEEAAGDGVDAVVDGFGEGLGEFASEAEEPEGGEVAAVVVVGELVGGQLELDEAVVGHVFVEGADDPVAVGVGIGEAFADVAGVGVAGYIEPVAAPALAVARGGEEAVD